MCVSRLHLVVDPPAGAEVTVQDIDGSRHRVSLLAYEGDPPAVGDWLVVHSGYALEQVDTEEAERVAAELSAARDRDPEG
ncbi:MAG: HypC/HybG/HupF family hydrogenase formation chaperone [Acidimicrobiales bacterium]|jgi:hydrogenase maturation factor